MQRTGLKDGHGLGNSCLGSRGTTVCSHHYLKHLQEFFFLKKFIYLLLAVLGLRFCVRAFSSCGKRGPLLIVVRGPLTIAASLVVEHRLQTCRLSSCGSRAQPLRGMWDLPRPGLEPMSPALAGRLSTTAPPGKPTYRNFVVPLSPSSPWTQPHLQASLTPCPPQSSFPRATVQET